MTPFSEVPIVITSGENKSRSPHFANQTCLNLYIDKQRSGRAESALMPWPGETRFSKGGPAKIVRGMYFFDNRLYVLADQSLYSILPDGFQYKVATIPGRDFVSFSSSGKRLIIRLSGTAAYINGKFILQGPGDTFLFDGLKAKAIVVPNINDDEALVSEVDLPEEYKYSPIKSQVTGGDYRQVYVFQKKIFFAGADFIDVYYDSGAGNPPIKPALQASSNSIGVASSHTMAQTPSYLYLLSPEGVVYRSSNFDMQPVSPSSISRELRERDISKAFGFTCQIDGQWFYVLQIRGGGATLAYSETTGDWSRLSSGVDQPPGPHIVQGYVYAYGKSLICGGDSSDVLEWDMNSNTANNGEPIAREFVTAPINGQMIGAPGKRILINRARFVMETGVGNDEQLNPKMMVQASFDGGRSFTKESNVSMKRAGDSVSVAEWDACHTFYDMCLRVRVTDPVFSSFHSAIAYLKTAGN